MFTNFSFNDFASLSYCFHVFEICNEWQVLVSGEFLGELCKILREEASGSAHSFLLLRKLG